MFTFIYIFTCMYVHIYSRVCVCIEYAYTNIHMDK